MHYDLVGVAKEGFDLKKQVLFQIFSGSRLKDRRIYYNLETWNVHAKIIKYETLNYGDTKSGYENIKF